jgi:hypothetical protein
MSLLPLPRGPDSKPTAAAPPSALWETHTIWTSPATKALECWLWTGPYRTVAQTTTPIVYFDNSRFSARVVVAADHGLCHFTDNIMVQMACKNPRCVAPHHMRLTQRMPRFRAPASGKRTHASMTQTEDGDESVSVTPQLTADASPAPKRARIAPKLDGQVLSGPVPPSPVPHSFLSAEDDDD